MLTRVVEAGEPAGGRDRDLRALYALLGLAGSAFIPFFVLFLRERGLEPQEIGVVLAVGSLAGVVASPFWSHAADTRLGSARTLELACAATALVALALLPTGSSVVAIAAVSGVLYAAQSPWTSSTDALALAQLGPSRMTEYGSFRLFASIGWGVGAIAFGALFGSTGLDLMLPLVAVTSVLYAVEVSRFPRLRPSPMTGGSAFGAVGRALRAPRLVPFLVGVLVLATSTHAAWDYVPLRIVAGGGGAFLVGISSGVSAFVEIPFMRATRSLIDRLGVRTVFAIGAAVYAAAAIGWSLVADAGAVTAIRVGIGVGFGLVYPSLVVMTGRLVPAEVRNSGQALMSICSFGLAPMIGGAVGGFVYQHVGPVQLFAGSAVGVAAGAAIVWASVGHVGARTSATAAISS